MPDLYGNKTEREKELEAYVQWIINWYGGLVDSDEDYPGTQAVDDISDIVRVARRVLNAG